MSSKALTIIGQFVYKLRLNDGTSVVAVNHHTKAEPPTRSPPEHPALLLRHLPPPPIHQHLEFRATSIAATNNNGTNTAFLSLCLSVSLCLCLTLCLSLFLTHSVTVSVSVSVCLSVFSLRAV